MARIRHMAHGDTQIVLDALYLLKNESPYFDGYKADAAYVEKNLARMLDSPGNIALIANDYSGFMLGVVGSNWFSPTVEANEALLYVFPESRGSLTAVALIKQFEREAKRYGAYCINAGASLGIKDDSVLKLYKLLGYQPKGAGVTKRIH